MWMFIAILVVVNLGSGLGAAAKPVGQSVLGDPFWPFNYREGAVPLPVAPPAYVKLCRKVWFADFLPMERKIANQQIDQGGRAFLVGNIAWEDSRLLVMGLLADDQLRWRSKDSQDTWQGFWDTFKITKGTCKRMPSSSFFAAKPYDQTIDNAAPWERALAADVIGDYLDQDELGTMENALKMRDWLLSTHMNFSLFTVEIEKWLIAHGWTKPPSAAPASPQ